MGFSSKRGRPKAAVGKLDKGTKELQAKRRKNQTAEGLDLLLQKSLISEDEHRAALHLRWLFTVKNGAPNISAFSYEDFSGNGSNAHDNSWYEQRQSDYHQALQELSVTKTQKIVMDVAIYDLLKFPMQARDLHNLRDGLRLLCKLWRKRLK